MSGAIYALIGGAVLLVLLVLYIMSRIKVAGPNEAFIVTVLKSRPTEGPTVVLNANLSGQKVVIGA